MLFQFIQFLKIERENQKMRILFYFFNFEDDYFSYHYIKLFAHVFYGLKEQWVKKMPGNIFELDGLPVTL